MPSAQPDLRRLRIDRDAPAGRRGGVPGWLLVLLLLLFGGYAAWKEGLLFADERPAVRLGRVVTTGKAPPPSGVSANGYVVARRQAALSTDIQGRLIELHFEEGDRVETGDVIAQLDTRALLASLEQTEAQLLRARARLKVEEAEYQRRETLLAAGDVSQEARDQALALRDEASADVARLLASIEEIEVAIDKSSIYAPFGGVVTAKNAEVGEVVSSLAGSANSRAAVVTLVDFDTLEVQVELSQTSLAVAQVGRPVEIYLDAWPTEAYPGRVRQIWPTANRTKATVEVRCTFDERDERILPEMGVRVVFLDELSSAAREAPEGEAPSVRVPAAAVVGGADDPAVFLYVDGRVRRQGFRPAGGAQGGEVPVASGLDGNERVVLDPPASLTDGDAVRVKEDA